MSPEQQVIDAQAPVTTEVTGGQLAVEALEALGVTVVFGVPGGQTLAIMDALIDSGIRFVTTRHEYGAAAMADVHGRLTGRPGVCLATTGPGATNLLTAIGGAYRDSSPVLILTCNNKLDHLNRDDLQGADHLSVFRPLTKWATMAPTAGSVTQAVQEAYLRATAGCPGPVLLDFARDAVESTIARPAASAATGATSLAAYDQRPAADPAAVAEACRLLAAAERPMIWLGNGAKVSRAGAAALALAELLQAPIATTYNGTGSVPGNHPLVFGPLNRMGTQLSSRVLQESDLVLMAGNSLNGGTTGRWTMEMPGQLIQVDLVPEQIGSFCGDRTLGLVGDAGRVLEQIAEGMSEVTDASAGAKVAGRVQWLADLADAKTAWWQWVAKNAASSADQVRPDTLVTTTRRVFPDDTVFIADGGNPGLWSFLWQVPDTGKYFKPVGFANLGFSLPAAIAASLYEPDKQVVALSGDGSLGMILAELETLAREGGHTRCRVLVMDDSGYGNIRQEQIFKYGQRPLGVDFQSTDYAKIAEAFGLKAFRVSGPADLESGLEAARDYEGPCLIHVPIDPDLNVWTYPPFQWWKPVGSELKFAGQDAEA